MINTKIGEFLKKLATKEPTPGGGSVSGLVASMGFGLTEMVIHLTIGKKGYEDVEDEMKSILEKSIKLREECLTLVKEDVNAFAGLMNAFKISKDNPKREQILQDAYIEATLVPLRQATICSKGLALASVVMEKGNKNVMSDTKAAMYFLHSCIKTSLDIIELNKSYIKDKKTKERIQRRYNFIVGEIYKYRII